MTPDASTDKLQSRRIKAQDGTTVVLTYLRPDAQAMRDTVASLRLRGDKRPSLSLIARRSLSIYLDGLTSARASNPQAFAAEMEALESMTAPLCPKTIERDAFKARRQHPNPDDQKP